MAVMAIFTAVPVFGIDTVTIELDAYMNSYDLKLWIDSDKGAHVYKLLQGGYYYVDGTIENSYTVGEGESQVVTTFPIILVGEEGPGQPPVIEVIPVVPVIVWQDRAAPHNGPGLRITQTGEGVWRNMHVWRYAYAADATPPAPVEFTAETKGPGRIALRWRHGRRGRVNCTYDVHRDTREDFHPTTANRIADRVACMNTEIDTVPEGSDGVLFIPHLRGSIVPHRMPAARGGFLGLREVHSRAHMARAVYEGLAMEYRLIVDRLGEILALDFADIRCFGGGSQNAAWVQTKANVLNRPVIVYQTQENTCLGAAILAGLGCGLYSSLGDAFSQIRHPRSTVEPEPEKARRYEPLYQNTYQPMFTHLKEINRLIEP